MPDIELQGLICKDCGRRWFPRGGHQTGSREEGWGWVEATVRPERCPNPRCTSAYWDRPLVAPALPAQVTDPTPAAVST